ncbi:MAG: HRDC domain-containing protein, partial [Alkalispirochaeta sp.]
ESGGYLERQKIEGQSRPGGFRLTASGRQVLGARQTVVSAATAEREGSGSGARRRRRDPSRGAALTTDSPAGTARDASAIPLREDQQRLFERLRLLRKELARARSVPPYVILSDKSLKVIARNRPTDRAGLLRCHGIGEAKLEQFGDELLQTIRSALGDPEETG